MLAFLWLGGCGSESERCTPGQAGCACAENRTCGEGLECMAEVCSNADDVGGVGQPCHENRTCDWGARCEAGLCEACELGTEGCGCRDDNSCEAELSCEGMLCATETERSVPENPECFTPCREGFRDASGTYRECPPDGLMKGCIDGAECVEGSCLLAKMQRPTCDSDSACADFQVCIEGHCYADCNDDAECPVSARCHRHACRLPCGSSAATCPRETYCAITDGDRGFCMPLTEPTAEAPHEVVPGSFALSARSLALSNLKSTQTLVLAHTAPYAIEFTVRKVEHRRLSGEPQEVTGAKALPWLRIGTPGSAKNEAEVKLVVDAEGVTSERGELELVVEDDAPALWEGTLEISSPELGSQRVELRYAERPDGRWSGKQYYFGQFADQGLDAWRTDPSNEARQRGVKNAFVRKWAGLRSLMGGGNTKTDVKLFEAVLQATLTESWRWPSIQELCPVAACLPFDNAQGFAPYVDDLDDAPVPTGVLELPLALDLRTDGDALRGRIVSEQALHYAGDPAFGIEFAARPDRCTMMGGDCLLFTKPSAPGQVSARALVGGRYAATADNADCKRAGPGLFLAEVPALIPGFRSRTQRDPETGLSASYECRDGAFPFGASASALNASLAQANPVPDGRRRVRALEVVDGMMVNGETLYLLFKEYFEGPALGLTDTGALPAYGIMVLGRTNENLTSKDFEGTTPENVPSQAIDLTELTQCSPELLRQALGSNSALNTTTAPLLVDALLDGVSPDVTPVELANEAVHYLCHDTGLFDQGSSDGDVPKSCPAGSGVTFFTGNVPPDLSGLACQGDGSCQSVLDAWGRDPGRKIALDPVWRCASDNGVYCDKDRLDLRAGKVFFAPRQPRVLFPPLHMEIDDAFRYRTQFQNRKGETLGFAPAVCEPDSSIVPYCYDPQAIEEVEERTSCLVWLFTQRGHLLDEATYQRTRQYLTLNFSNYEEHDPRFSAPIVHDGFEFLNAQLLITLGDESFTRAFQSRFDLAGAARAGFEGAKLEDGGIDLSGVAGFELYTLYQATQYYQKVLDRFFSLAGFLRDDVQAAIHDVPPRLPRFVTQKTVTSYIDRALRASTQKTRAYSEIAKRYQSFQRPDLARRVVERAYTGAYLESMLVTRLMVEISDALVASGRAQVESAIDRAQRVYRAAMLEMRELYASLDAQTNAYGYAPDYIPFPELEPDGPNAFHVLLRSAQQKLSLAQQHEENALAQSRTFDTSQEEFQRELASIRTNYENQLAELCGTFTGDDGNVYPAIAKYAYLSERARLLGDPCGLMGNGAIHGAIASLETLELDVQGVHHAYDNLSARIDIEHARIREHCDTIESIADYEYEVAGKVINLQEDMAKSQALIRSADRLVDATSKIYNLLACNVGLATSCGSSLPLAATLAGMFNLKSTVIELLERDIVKTQSEIADIQRTSARWRTEEQCELARIDSDALVRGYLLELKSIDIEAMRSDYRLRLALSEIDSLRNQASRLYAEQEDTAQLAINVEAARNDPNVRIYKNDAVLNADRSFAAALQAAYKATKAYEYYTSQSYAGLDALALVRLVSRGDYNLEDYLRELEDGYASFSESFGRPDVRVDILSLRDDVLGIPRHDSDGLPLAESERVRVLREALTGTEMLDANGYLSVPFATSLARLSPVTRNHKILHVEAEIIGSDVGDALGRLYLRQSGTGVLRSVNDAQSYYRFPARMAVLDPFFNGVRAYQPDLYRNDRLRDRPYVNTHWELLLNQVDEQHNQDINLNALTDIRILVYYTDFTSL